MVDPWVWAVLLLVLGWGLALLEVFFTSMGVLAFLSAAAILGAIIMGFRQGPMFGMGIVLMAVAGLPTIVVLAFRWWPKTSIGRKILLTVPNSDDVLPDDPEKERLKTFVGRVGKARTKMLLSGAVTIDGHTVDAVSEVPIEVGQAVRVVQVRGTRVVVRPAEQEMAAETAKNVLERPIDAVIPDPFEEPPA